MKQFKHEKIREFREAAGMTPAELSSRLGIHFQALNRWERGRGSGLTVKSLVKLCEVLNKSTDDFFVDIQRPSSVGPGVGGK